jgi:D-arabinose 1-dehydrogenase-like Zn-dependent alcohol dehydrogenase
MKAVVIKEQNGEVAVEERERPDIRDALQFAATHDVRPQITKRPLEDAADVLDEMHERRLRGRVVLTMA